MAYNQFTLQRVIADFGLTVNTVPDLFAGVPPVPVTAEFYTRLRAITALATTEAARSNFLIAPLLAEVWRRAEYRVALFAGARFDVDEPAGLVGVCDFILARPPQLPYVTGPVMMIVEAKNEDIPGGLGQCAAAMVAAQRFNAGRATDAVFGAVTDGERWRFLRLAGPHLDIDMVDYVAAEPDRIVGVLFHACGIRP